MVFYDGKYLKQNKSLVEELVIKPAAKSCLVKKLSKKKSLQILTKYFTLSMYDEEFFVLLNNLKIHIFHA